MGKNARIRIYNTHYFICQATRQERPGMPTIYVCWWSSPLYAGGPASRHL